MMRFTLEIASEADVADIAKLHCAASGGKFESALKGISRRMRESRVYVTRQRGSLIATLCLTRKKPWAIDPSYFTPVAIPLYLLAMAVDPRMQRRGIGRQCLLAAEKIARDWPANAIRLDAYDSPTGAGGFYQRCGYREVGRAVYRKTPLIYYERLVANAGKD